MDKSRLTHLFQAYFNKTATSQERSELMELLVHAENDEEVKILLAQTWQQFNSQGILFNDSTGDEMLLNILQKPKPGKIKEFAIKYKRPYSWLRIAAAAILFFAFTVLYFWVNQKQPGPQIAQSKTVTKEVAKVIAPGGNKAILTLSDGSNIVLDSTDEGTLTQQGNVKIIRLDKATLAYNSGNATHQEIVYNTLSTPVGGQYQLILQDGTRVWLNAASSIHFPTIFNGKERNVTVTGEAYFEVAKNPSMPFKINVGDMEVQVLGTHFNIMAYSEESSMNTTLLEGSLKVTKGALNSLLVPGQEARISRTGSIKLMDANIEEVMAWKNGWFQFNGYDIEKVMRQISRWYDVEIVYEGKIPTGHFTGSVNRGNDISQVLKILQAGGVRFKVEGRRIFVLS